MASNKDNDAGKWVEERLAMLAPAEEWEPNVEGGIRGFRRGRERKPAWIRAGIGVSAVAGAICFCLLVWPPTRVLARSCVNACLAQASIAGDMLRHGIPGTRTGELAPERKRIAAADFVERDQQGNTVRLSEFRGHIVVLNFWATWCSPCRKEIPSLDELQQKYRDSGVVVLGVSLNDDGWKSVTPFLKSNPMLYRVMSGSGLISGSFADVTVLPTTFLIDSNGRIAAKHFGAVDKSVYEREIAELLREQ